MIWSYLYRRWTDFDDSTIKVLRISGPIHLCTNSSITQQPPTTNNPQSTTHKPQPMTHTIHNPMNQGNASVMSDISITPWPPMTHNLQPVGNLFMYFLLIPLEMAGF